MVKVVTCTAPVNIAVIKYWGKRDEKRVLPLNDSISLTLSSEQMNARTSVSASPEYRRDRLWLNGEEESVEDNPRLSNCLREVRASASPTGGSVDPRWKVHVSSENNFPTAAGLASSAAGYACLVYALCELYGVRGDVSALARQGSGSACRSIHGGFVRWRMGAKRDGSDSISEVVRGADHWPEMRCLILVANDARKKVASSKGMKLSVDTSEFLAYRAEKLVPERAEAMAAAIENRDFGAFAKLTMKDSNSLHAVCLDTYPPCFYMNQVSHAVVDLVHQINAAYAGKEDAAPIVAYTFDAGPNACLFLLERDVPLVLAVLKHFFPAHPDAQNSYVQGREVAPGKVSEEELNSKFSTAPMPPGSLKYIISTALGDGPKVMEAGHLLDEANGLPVVQKKIAEPRPFAYLL